MNILLTDYCNRSCTYCFAKEKVSHKPGAQTGKNMPLANLVKAVDFFVASRRDRVSLLGGEPTQHPQFAEILQYIAMRGLNVHIFSNGMVDEAQLQKIGACVDEERTTFTINLNHPQQRSKKEQGLVHGFLTQFGHLCGAGVNIHTADMDLSFLLDDMDKYGMKQRVRVGISHPAEKGSNSHLPIEKYPGALDNLTDFMGRVQDRQVEFSLDCGFPMCLFSDEQLGLIYRSGRGGKRNFRCSPVIDIGPDLDVWACFPMGSLGNVKLDDFHDARELGRHFTRQLKSKVGRRGTGIFRECDGCVWKERDLCTGGCQAYLLLGRPVSRKALVGY
jgi:MoaA/NifB/PqqE/SkfB family radical SAM enzyme